MGTRECPQITTLCFADDQVLIAQDHDDINYVTRKFTEEYHKWGLDIDINKIECTSVGGEQRNLTFENEQKI